MDTTTDVFNKWTKIEPENENELVQEIDKKVQALLSALDERELTNRETVNGKDGPLTDNQLLLELTNIIIRPASRELFFDEPFQPDFLPYVYYGHYWADDDAVKLANKGYRIWQGEVMSSELEKVSLHDSEGAESLFKKYASYSYSDLESISSYLSERVKRVNRIIYFRIFEYYKHRNPESKEAAIAVMRLMFQWANGAILNHFPIQFQLTNKCISAALRLNDSRVSPYWLEELNGLREYGDRLSLQKEMTHYIMEKLAYAADVKFEHFHSRNLIGKTPVNPEDSQDLVDWLDKPYIKYQKHNDLYRETEERTHKEAHKLLRDYIKNELSHPNVDRLVNPDFETWDKARRKYMKKHPNRVG